MKQKHSSERDDKLLRAFDRFAGIYRQFFQTFQNWVLAINSGGAISVLSYIANKNMHEVHCCALAALCFFMAGVLTGMCWAFFNYLFARSAITELQEFAKTTDKPEDFKPSDKAKFYDTTARFFCGTSVLFAILGAIFGLIAVFNQPN